MPPSLLSIVVPAFNEEKLLDESLRAILKAAEVFESPDWKVELIVCDNNSTDKTSEIARSAGALVVFEPINQIGRARNAGAAAAKGYWILFIDADSRPSTALFRDLKVALESGHYLGGGTTLILDNPDFVLNAGTQVWNWISRIQKWVAGSFIFIRRSAFEEIGGFSLELFAGEEIELSKQMRKIARRDGLGMKILSRNPMVTSARKAKLYSRKELASFFFRAMLRPKKTTSTKADCEMWYDGRR
ncbi:MAG: hypothetical protein JWM04_1483 [Verrucomicrobiales bacterium]|nr:hypothetical protein [Verrucomicrobiales bacterium]